MIDIIKKADEWSDFDYNFAEDLLKEKGITFTDDEKAEYFEERMDFLAEPQRAKWYILFFAYVMVMGLLGPLIGMFLWQGKIKLPNGVKVFRYDSFTRTHGAIVGVLGLSYWALMLSTGYALMWELFG